MTHSKVERIEKILQLADNFKNKSDQSFQKSLLKEKQKINKEDESEKPADKKESFQEMLDRLFFEEEIKK